MTNSNRTVALSLRLYRGLANAFPQEFRSAYGDDLLDVTEDSIEFIWRRHGTWGLVRLIADLAIRVPAEHLTELGQDIRYGLRMLAKSPGFTTVAMLSLGLGICIATAVYTEFDISIMRSLPLVSKPDQLVCIQGATSYPNYERYRERSDLFQATAAYVAPVPFGILLNGRSERTWGHLVTPDYFSIFGIRPSLGRFFDEKDQRRGQAATVVISNRFWRNRLGSDWGIVGKTLRINGHPSTVIGVAPDEFLGASPMMLAADVWMPVMVDAHVAPELADNALERRDATMFQMVARLKPGVTIKQAEAELDTLARGIEAQFGDPDRHRKGRRVTLASAGKVVPIRSEDLPLFIAFPAVLVGLVLLIACSNVANMMLARAAGRRKEIAIRLAIGASRWRLIRQLLTESMLIALGAGVIGLVLSGWLLSLAARMPMPYPVPMHFDLTLNSSVLLFTLLLSLLVSLAFGLAPALQATRADVTPALKEGGEIRLSRYRRLSLRNLLVLYQVAGSLMLLLLTGFLVRGFQKTTGNTHGLDWRNLYLVSLDPVRDGYSSEQAAAFFDKLSERVKGLPSVVSSSLTESVPLGMTGAGSVTFHETNGGTQVIHSAKKYVVGNGYFETLGYPMLAGRSFRKEDEANDATAVVVNEKLVQEFWKGEDPVGRRIQIAGNQLFSFDSLKNMRAYDNATAPLDKTHTTYEVVGVAKDSRMEFIFDEQRPAMYFPLRPAEYAHPPMDGMTLMVRSTPGVDAIGAVRRTVGAMDANITLFNARTMRDQLDSMQSMMRTASYIYGTIGLFGLALASIGLAGVTAYAVVRRRREIGIRMALGAQRTDALSLVMKESAALIAIGTVLGFGGAWAVSRVMSAFLAAIANAMNASTTDPVLLIGAPSLLACLAFLGCFLPARKSMKIDPITALRQE